MYGCHNSKDVRNTKKIATMMIILIWAEGIIFSNVTPSSVNVSPCRFSCVLLLIFLLCSSSSYTTLMLYSFSNVYIMFSSTSVHIHLVLLMYCNVTKCNIINMRSTVQWSVITLLCLIFFRSFFVMYCNGTKWNIVNMRSPVQWSVITLLCLIFFRSFFVM